MDWEICSGFVTDFSALKLLGAVAGGVSLKSAATVGICSVTGASALKFAGATAGLVSLKSAAATASSGAFA